MKKIAVLGAALFWISVQAYAQTPSPNAHAPEQPSETFPQGDPTARTDSMKSKLIKNTQSSRNARRSEAATTTKQTTVKRKTTKTVKKKPDTTPE
ncbi:hypothetical protein GCM10027347_20960 [Larkinella harenae]